MPQLREITAEFACVNFHLKNRVGFKTITHDEGKHMIITKFPSEPPVYHPKYLSILGKIKHFILEDFKENVHINDYSEKLIKNEITFFH
jgi:hypothetical protein